MSYDPEAPPDHYVAQQQRRQRSAQGDSYNRLAGAPEDIIGRPSEYRTVTKPSRSWAWVGFIAVVAACAVAGTIMGGIALANNKTTEDEFGDLYRTNRIFYTNLTTFIAGADPDAGAVSPGAYVSIQRVGYKVDVTVKFDLRNSLAGTASPIWCNPTSTDVFNGTLGAYVDVSCFPPPAGYVPCANSTAFPLCENITSGAGAHPGSRVVPAGGLAGPIVTQLSGVTSECNLDVTNLRAFDGVVNGTGPFIGGVFVPKTVARNTTTCAFNQPQTLSFHVSYMTLSGRGWQPPAECISSSFPVRVAPPACP